MCGRYTLRDVQRSLKLLGVEYAEDYLPRFNIAPTQTILTVTAARQLHEMIWGIVPTWTGATARVLINARAETVRQKPSFKVAFEHRRCLVPADGFYEWAQETKQPYLFELRDGSPFAIASLWEVREASHCCLITTAGNEVLAPHHHRMPVIVHAEDWDEWLAPEELSEESFQRIITPFPATQMKATPVSRLVNNARIDDSRCVEPESLSDAAVPKAGRKIIGSIPYDEEQDSDVMSRNDLRLMSEDQLRDYGLTPQQREDLLSDSSGI